MNARAVLALNVYSDQIVWGRSPVRIDMAGGWTDTPPYSLFAGGSVVNIAIELNGQPPLQVYIKPCAEHRIVLRSIDMGAMEVVNTFEELQSYCMIGSPFSIPKAALALAGFVPAFSETAYPSLEKQLESLRHRYRDYIAFCHTCRFRSGHKLHFGFYCLGFIE